MSHLASNSSQLLAMVEFNHLVLVKFKEDVVVEDILKGLEKLASEMESVKSFVWSHANLLCIVPILSDVPKGTISSFLQFSKMKMYNFCRGQDIESEEMLRQGFTHAFLMTFSSKDEFIAFATHPNHVEFSSTFSTAIEKAALLDFPVVTVKLPA